MGVGTIHQEGLQFFLELANGEQSKPANYYMGSCEDASIAVDANLAALTENTGDGYERVAITSDSVDLVSATDGAGGWQLTTKVCRFTADGGNWNCQKHVFLATTIDDSGKLVASGPCNGGTGWTLTDGQYFEESIVANLQQPA
jgi:hypothetical protein